MNNKQIERKLDDIQRSLDRIEEILVQLKPKPTTRRKPAVKDPEIISELNKAMTE